MQYDWQCKCGNINAATSMRCDLCQRPDPRPLICHDLREDHQMDAWERSPNVPGINYERKT